ncbi:MAG TPA: Holliday junction branch migration protein RuvA [Gammaproteobacteria bacterium]|nr:Holliday junction branch migration protein RuvA [Gammaproteobacteria bacterium]
MIAHLKGTVSAIRLPMCIVDVNGVGYVVELTHTDLARLEMMKESVLIHTHLVVREDNHSLYGFLDVEAVQVFQTLIKVNGVGPKLALNILSHFSLGELRQCIQSQDIRWMCQIKGVGKKVAERLLVELKHCEDRLPQVELSSGAGQYHQQAVDALIKLGYKPQAASKAISSIKNEKCSGLEDLIRRALPILSQV